MKSISRISTVILVSGLMTSCFLGGSKDNKGLGGITIEKTFYGDDMSQDRINVKNTYSKNGKIHQNVSQENLKSFQVRDDKTGLIS